MRAEQFLCVKHALQYVNGHAGALKQFDKKPSDMESKRLIKFDKSPYLKIWAITCMPITHPKTNNNN